MKEEGHDGLKGKFLFTKVLNRNCLEIFDRKFLNTRFFNVDKKP